MYPIFDVEIRIEVSETATYWIPEREEISDEGFGFLRDVWAVLDVEDSEVEDVLAWEREAAEYVVNNSESSVEFDDLATDIESYSPYSDGEEHLPQGLDVNWGGLGDLELGVSGLVHALSNAGFYPAASCRTHPHKHWTGVPVVIFATDKERLNKLFPLAQEANCGINEDFDHGAPLFAIYGASIVDTMTLASKIFHHRAEFNS